MTILLSLIALLALSFLVLKDGKENIRNRSPRFHLRILSAVGPVLLFLAGCLTGSPVEMEGLVVALSAGTALLMMYPCSYEKPEFSLKMGMTVLAVNLALLLLTATDTGIVGRARSGASVSLISTHFLTAFCVIGAAVKKMGALRTLFRNTSVWNNLEDYSRFIYLVVFQAVSLLVYAFPVVPGFMACLSFTALLSLYTILYLKALSGRTFVLSKEKEERIKEMIKGNLRTSCADKVNEDAKMNALYRRILEYMTEYKPYLDSTFDMAELAEKMFTNKLYLSKTINILSGRNFRQFINYHRVKYAVDLVKKDPKLKVSEVAEMSGFNSVVSFNMAFKINMGQTPSDWTRDYVSSREFMRRKL